MYNYICFLPVSSRSIGVADIVGMYTVGMYIVGMLLELWLSMVTKYER